MVQSKLIISAALLAGASRVAASPDKQGMAVHPVNVPGGYIKNVETQLNTVTGVAKAAAAAPVAPTRNVVYVTQTAYYDDSGKQAAKRDDNSKYSAADLQLAAQIKPLLEGSHDAYVKGIKDYTDSNGNFELDRAATNAAQGIQLYDMFIARRRGNGNGGNGLAKRATPSQQDLIKGLKPSLQLGYDANAYLGYGNYDDAALDSAHKLNVMADGGLDINDQYPHTDASRQLASDMGPLFKYGKQQVDGAVKEYTDSNGNFDADRAASDIVRAIQMAQRYADNNSGNGGNGGGARNVAPRDDDASAAEFGNMLVDLGARLMQGETLDVAAMVKREDMNSDEVTKAIKAVLVRAHDVYTRVNETYTDASGNFDYDAGADALSLIMEAYKEEIAEAKARSQQQQ